MVSSPNDVDKEPQELGRFAFNGQGITNISPPGANGSDPLLIHEGGCAYGIVGSFLAAAF